MIEPQDYSNIPVKDQPLVYRLLKRAEIRRGDANRLSVQEGKPDKISDLLEEAAAEIVQLQRDKDNLEKFIEILEDWLRRC